MLHFALSLRAYSKELSLGNQPLETQCWIWPQFLGNWLAGSKSLSFQHCAPQAEKIFENIPVT